MNYEYLGFPNHGLLKLSDLNQNGLSEQLAKGYLYKIIWTKQQGISLGVDGYRILLKPNHLVFCTPINKLDIPKTNKDARVFAFNREFYCIRDHDSEVACNGFLFLGSSFPVIVELSETEQKSFELLFMFFEEEFNTKDHIQGEMLLVLLKRLLIKSVRIARKLMPDPDMPQSKLDTIRQFNLLVEIHFREKHKVVDYAELLNITPKSLSNLFLKYHTKSPLKVISERICLEGQRLLTFSEKNTNEIAFELGFTEASHFSKFFKKHTGLSPKAYKENL